MFTGIVRGTGSVISVNHKENFIVLTIIMPEDMIDGLETGASVAVNGCCLTVTGMEKEHITFDVMLETLRTTNLGQLSSGSFVNLERAARFGDEIGGHQLSGHILCTAKVQQITKEKENCTMWFVLPPAASPYIFHKGYIAINGISLTVGAVEKERFCVYLIPETFRQTTMNTLVKGCEVNIEVDPQTQVIVETVKRILPGFLEKN